MEGVRPWLGGRTGNQAYCACIFFLCRVGLKGRFKLDAKSVYKFEVYQFVDGDAELKTLTLDPLKSYKDLIICVLNSNVSRRDTFCWLEWSFEKSS